MTKFPTDAPKAKVLKALSALGFQMIREGNHIAMARQNPDGSKTSLTLPNHQNIKGSTLISICTQCGIKRDDFVRAYEDA